MFVLYSTKWIYEVFVHRQTRAIDRLTSSGKKLVSVAQLRYEVLSDRFRRQNTRQLQTKLVQINLQTECTSLIHINVKKTAVYTQVNGE